jgi:hypothetical protein
LKALRKKTHGYLFAQGRADGANYLLPGRLTHPLDADGLVAKLKAHPAASALGFGVTLMAGWAARKKITKFLIKLWLGQRALGFCRSGLSSG